MPIPALAGLNVAVSWCSPGDKRDVVVPDAVPLMAGIGLPRGLGPSMNCTVPVASTGVTIAVNVTVVPYGTGEVGEVFSTVFVAVGGMGLHLPDAYEASGSASAGRMAGTARRAACL
jgi:hypothetical protein